MHQGSSHVLEYETAFSVLIIPAPARYYAFVGIGMLSFLLIVTGSRAGRRVLEV